MLKRTFTLGRYHCVEALGSGPLGETWRAKLYGVAGLERQYALLRIHAQLLSNADFVALLDQAVAGYRTLEHEGLVRLHDVGRAEGQYYLVFDHAGACDLRRLHATLSRAQGDLAVDRAQGVVAIVGRDVAAALVSAHQQGVLHLGLHPACVLIDGQGQVRVTDTGLLQARLLRPFVDEPDLLKVLPYLAPEVLRGEAADPRSDVFSLSAVLFELLTGGPAFSGDSPAQIRAQVERGLRSEPVVPGTQELSAAFGPILRRALSARPQERQASMAELLSDLMQVPIGSEEAIRAQLLKLGRRLQSREAERMPSTMSEPGADPLPPPPGLRPEEGRAFVPPPAEGMLPSRNSDVLRDVPLMVTSAQILARSASGPAPVAAPVFAGASRGAEGRFSEPRRRAAERPASADSPSGRSRAMVPGSGPAPERPPGSLRRILPSAAFALEEEESTVPVPHSPKSKIVVIEADPPGAGRGLLLEETPLPISIPMVGTNPAIEATRVDGDPAPGAASGPNGVAAPPPGAALWSSFADSGPTTMTEKPARPSGAGAAGSGAIPPARVIPGRLSARGRPAPDHDTDSAVLPPRSAAEDDSDLFGMGRLGSLPGDPLGQDARTSGTEAKEAAPRKPGIRGKRPAGFTDFDEPTALADYSDASLAGLVGMSLRDRSGPVSMASGAAMPAPGSRSLESSGAAMPGAATTAPPSPAASLAEAYAPLITAPVPLAVAEEVAAAQATSQEVPALPEAVPVPVDSMESGGDPVPARSTRSPLMVAAASTEVPSRAELFDVPRRLPSPGSSLSPPRQATEPSPPGSWPLPTPQVVESKARPVAQSGMRRGLVPVMIASFVCSVLVGVGAPRLYRWTKARRQPLVEQGGALTKNHQPDPVTPDRPNEPAVQPGTATQPANTVGAGEKLALITRPPEPASPATEKPLPPPGEAGLLALSSQPAAGVFVDGKPGGRTPVSIKLSEGPHQLLLVAEKYRLWQKEVQAGGKLEVKLEPAHLSADVAGKSGLKVRCSSKGQLRILVDDQDSGISCPSGRIGVAPGPHVIGFVRPATGDRQTRDVTVKKGNSSTRLYTKF